MCVSVCVSVSVIMCVKAFTCAKTLNHIIVPSYIPI